MPTQITTSTADFATAYTNQRKIDRTSNGVLWAVVNPAGASDAQIASWKFWYSTNNGSTWTEDTAARIAPNGTGRYSGVNGSLFIDQDDYAHFAYREVNNGYIYYRRGTPNAARTAWTWSAAQAILTGVYGEYPDIVAHREGTGWVAHIVMSIEYNTGSDMRVWHYRVPISSNGTISTPVQTDLHPSPAYGNSGETYPSIDFHHTGDGKTIKDGTPHLYVAWSAGAAGAGKGIRFKKATYSGGSWTWGTEREIDSTRYVSSGVIEWLNCLFDGTRVIIGGWLRDSGGSASYDLILHDRDAADTTTTSRVLVDSGAAATWVKSGSMSYDSNGNVYLVGADETGANGTRIGHYFKWARATATLGPAVVYDSTLNNTPHVSAKRGYSGGKIEFIYTDGTASPYSITYGSISLNSAPTAPTNVVVSRAGAASIDVGWTHNDPDNDPQKEVQIRYRRKMPDD